MMAGQHATLSPSSAHIWLNCPPAARLAEQFEDAGSIYAQQGTDAHALCEYKLLKALGHECNDPTEELQYYDAEMEQCAEDYATFIMETLAEAKEVCPDPTVMVEQRLDFSGYVPEGFGHGDCLVIADNSMHVVDFKYGMGVLVAAEHNPQMMCYAIGALELLDSLYDFDTVSMTIFQPRRQNVSTYTIKKAELLDWAENTLKPVAKLAFDGKGEFVAGEHCKFCKAKAVCRKRAEYNQEMARYDFKKPACLENAEIVEILGRLDMLVSWADDVKAYALQEALNGTHYEGYKVVEGRSNRKYTDEDAVAAAVIASGADPYEKKLRMITDMTKLLGTKRFSEILGKLVYKPNGKPVLVKETDERPEYNTAKSDFTGGQENV